MRTVITVIDGVPCQAPRSGIKLPFDVIDLRDLAVEVREVEALRLASAAARRPFDLTRGPLLRVNVFKLAPREQILLYTIHHIIADGPSCRILIEEAATLYEAALNGSSAALPALPIQFADFAAWQRTQLSQGVIDERLAYWRQELAGAPATLSWPLTRRAAGGSAALRAASIPGFICEKLKPVCQREQATLFMLLLTAFVVVLRCYTGQEEMVVGSDINKREHPETLHLIGFFINQLVIRADVTGDPGFTEILRRIRRNCLTAYAHRDLPFESLVKTMNPDRYADHSPLFQVKLVLQQRPAARAGLSGMTFEPLEIGNGRAQLDLILNMTETDGALEGVWEYNLDLFGQTEIEELTTSFEAVLQEAIENPEIRVSAIKNTLVALRKQRTKAEAETLREVSRSRFSNLRRRPVVDIS